MKLDELTDEQLAWEGLDADMTLEEIPKWLNRFADSGNCGDSYPGDAFSSSTNAMATWVSCLAELLEKKIQEFKGTRGIARSATQP